MTNDLGFLSEGVKVALNRIRSKISKLVGREVTLSEVLEVMVYYFHGKERELASYICGVKLPLSKDELSLLLNSSMDWGVETSKEELDKLLYGVTSK